MKIEKGYAGYLETIQHTIQNIQAQQEDQETAFSRYFTKEQRALINLTVQKKIKEVLADPALIVPYAATPSITNIITSLEKQEKILPENFHELEELKIQQKDSALPAIIIDTMKNIEAKICFSLILNQATLEVDKVERAIESACKQSNSKSLLEQKQFWTRLQQLFTSIVAKNLQYETDQLTKFYSGY